MRHFLPLLCMAMLVAGGAQGRAAEAYPDTAVKAAFLLRFAEYVEWPAAPPEEFVIAVLDTTGMAAQLREFATRQLHGRPVRVRAVNSFAAARGAQILYVGSSGREELRSLSRTGSPPGMLIVSDVRQGLAHGSTINFLDADGRVRFEASLESASRAGLKISAELLSVAVRVVR
ncbi:MAG TPA: YfiR family protein [Steroidobacteraceae bacterium]|nr:YfiR family protein [Steroidobacteraceae bacterium]